MTREDIILMAQACWPSDRRMWAVDADLPRLERFAAIVEDAQAKRMHAEGFVTVGHMREQIAAEREAIIQRIPGGHSVDPQWVCDMIRARGQA